VTSQLQSHRLHSADLVDVILGQLGVVELHVPVHSSLTEQFVMVVVFIISNLNHDEVFPPLVLQLLITVLHDGQLADVVVDCLLAGRSSLQQSDGVVRSVHVVQGRVGLASGSHNVLH